MYFGNRTIRIHILRGILGLAALWGFLSTTTTHPWRSLILLAAAIYLLKGCPMCWTLGLIETIVMAVHKHNERRVGSGYERTSNFPSPRFTRALARN